MNIKKNIQRWLSCLLAVVLTWSLLPTAALAENSDHLLIEQVYGDGGENNDGTPIANSFVQLYNPTEEAIALDGYTLVYNSPRESKPGSTGGQDESLTLKGSVPAKGAYLIIIGEKKTTDAETCRLPEADQTWAGREFDNKVYTVRLQKNSETVDEVSAAESEDFLMGVGIEDSSAWVLDISKQKSIVRRDHSDTDTSSDFTVVSWKGNDTVTAEYAAAYAPTNSKGDRGSIPGADAGETDPAYPSVTTTDTVYEGFYNGSTTLSMVLIGRYNAGAMNADGGSAEIVAYNADAECYYAVNGTKGTLDMVSIADLGSNGSVTELTGEEISVKELVENGSGFDYAGTFIYGDATSVAVNTRDQLVAVAVQHADYDKNGVIALFSYDDSGSLDFVTAFETGVQPDMVTFTPDGGKILSADEGEPREGVNGTDPAGSVTIVTLDADEAADSTVKTVGFDSFDEKREELIEKGVILQKNTQPSTDLEPEYIAVSADSSTAYVALQEANAIAALDLDEKDFAEIDSLGLQDFSETAVDLQNNGDIQIKTYEHVYGIRMPDGVSIYETGGKTYLLTANEGDSRADWAGLDNESEGTTSPTGNVTLEEEVVWYNAALVDGLDQEEAYLFGGRSFSLFEVTGSGLKLVFDSGSGFESITAEQLPDYFNCSNDKIKLDNRSGKKGPEPESVTVGEIDGRTYAFVALERIGGIMTYDITEPDSTKFVNYINSRDFSDKIKDDVSPEGLAFVAASDSPTGNALLLAACEVSGTVAAYELKTVKSGENDTDDGPQIAVISDCHVYDENLGTSGTAFEAYLGSDRKMLVESTYILSEAVDRLLEQHSVKYVLIPGDLTKDGEEINHTWLAGQLQRLEDAGKQVFVINGNHDLSNGHAKSFVDESGNPIDIENADQLTIDQVEAQLQNADTVDQAAFRKIYRNFGGYDMNADDFVAMDGNSLSYAVDLGDSDYRLIAMDDCLYTNDTSADGRAQATGGSFDGSYGDWQVNKAKNTLNWVLDQIEQAVRDGKRPIGMMHHGLVPHTAIQSTFFEEYLTKDYETVAQKLADAGMNLVFTGHFHSQDAALYTSPNGSKLYDVETGSLVTYPSPIRYVTLDTEDVTGETIVSYESDHIDAVRNLTSAHLSAPDVWAYMLEQAGKTELIGQPVPLEKNFSDYSYNYLMAGLKGQVPGILYMALMSQQDPEQLDKMTAEELAALKVQLHQAAVNNAGMRHFAAQNVPDEIKNMTLADFLAACMAFHYAGDEDNNKLYSVFSQLVAGMQVSESDPLTMLLGNAAWALINDTTGTASSPKLDTVGDNTASFTLTALPTYPDTPAPIPDHSTNTSSDDDDDGYTVSLSSAAQNGTVTISPRCAEAGDTVTITVTPDDGYHLDGLTAVDEDGKILKLTERDGKYTFTMPVGRVVIKAGFVKDASVAASFTDVPNGYWATDAIAWAKANGYMNGKTASAFDPDGTVTRQQLWMILARLSGGYPANMTEARAWAVSNGISDGSNPTGAISRQQMVAILYRYAGQRGYDVSGGASLEAFPDEENVAEYAREAMAWSVANGIVGGTADDTLNPAGTASRAQFAVILMRFYEAFVG